MSTAVGWGFLSLQAGEAGKQLQALDFVFASPLGKIQSLVKEKKSQHRAKPWMRPFTPSRCEKARHFLFQGQRQLRSAVLAVNLLLATLFQ